VTKFITLKGLSFTIGFNPSPVLGGQNTTMTVTLSSGAPTGGLAMQMTAAPGSIVQVPATVNFVAGQTTATVPVTTSGVTSDTDVTVTGTLSATNHQSTVLTVKSARLAGITFNPASVPGLQSSQCTITMDSPAPAGGVTVTIINSNPNIVTLPASVVIPAGQSSITFTVPTHRVPRNLSSQVTALFGDSAVSATITVTIR
jgi:hypothetical protein